MSAQATLTPYAASVAINAALTKAGLKNIPPQMIYNYTTARIRNNKAPFIETVTIDGQVRVTEAGLAKWTKKYLAKKTAAVTS